MLNRTTSLPCKPPIKNKQLKRRHYDQCVRKIEHSTFTPLVLSTIGGIGKAATTFYKRLASSQTKGTRITVKLWLAEMSPEFCFIAVLNYVHQRCSLFNKQTNSGQSYQFAVSRFSDALNQVSNLPLYYYSFPSLVFQLNCFFFLTALDVCLLQANRQWKIIAKFICTGSGQ